MGVMQASLVVLVARAVIRVLLQAVCQTVKYTLQLYGLDLPVHFVLG